MNSNPTKQLLELVAKEQGVPKATIKQMIKHKVISYELIDGHYHIDADEVREALEEKKAIKTTPTPIANNTDYKSPKTLRVASTFSGIGATEQAIKYLNINHSAEAMVENDKHAIKTFLANHSVNNIYKDITTIDVKTFPDIDLLTISAPCQSFSRQGKGEGFSVPKGTLTFEALKIVKEKKPKWVVFENVDRLYSIDSGKSFEAILLAFKELGYTTKHQILNSKNFGSPQNRERVFIVAIREDLDQEFEFPEPSAVNTCVNDYISDDESIDYSDDLFDSSNIRAVETKVEDEDEDEDIKKVYELPHISFNSDRKVSSSDGITPCITCGSQAKFFDTKNIIFRYLTIKEKSLIQGFGEDFKFPVSKPQAKKQLGNTITIPVLAAIFKNLIPSEYMMA
jgi:DNA (cytosine-5)-methyltransferase 1